MDDPQQLSNVLKSCELDTKEVRFKVGEKVFWGQIYCDDMPGTVRDIRDGKVLVRFSGRGPWTGTDKWLEPYQLRRASERWR